MTSPNKLLPLSIRVGTYVKNVHTGEVFRVKCNCSASRPRHHTQRTVTANLDNYALASAQEITDATANP